MNDYDFIDSDLMAEEPETAYNVNRELNMAWRIVEETGANLILSGKAGTGKTTFLKRLREMSSKRIVVLAPTGVAAINAEGTTIHSFFQLPFSPYLPDKGFIGEQKRFYSFSRMKKRLISSMNLLVIDEISMVRPDTLDAIDHVLRRHRNPLLPFGGVQLLLIGDLRQLPPVVKESEWGLLRDHYESPYFFSSRALREAGYLSVELTAVYRQTDKEFIEILNRIREGETDDRTMSQLNSRYIAGFNPSDQEGYVRLTSHNYSANAINRSKMQALPTQSHRFTAEVTGEFSEQAYPAEYELELKEGAQVMFIKNDTGNDRKFYNGLIGKIVSIDDEIVTVAPNDGGPLIEVEPVEWENTKYLVDEQTKEIRQEVVGVFKQFPLRAAWAITIHKSQGLTFDKAIIDASSAFAAGQTYVALSRCRTLAGLVLENPIPWQAVKIDNTVDQFMDACKELSPSEEAIVAMGREYLRHLLASLFDMGTLRRAYEDFFRHASQYLVPLFPEEEEGLLENRRRIDELAALGDKFNSIYACRPIDGSQIYEGSILQEKIQNGSNYYIEHLIKIVKHLKRLPRDIGNAGYLNALNNSFDALMLQLGLKIRIFTAMSEQPFTASNYNNAYAAALLDMEQAQTPRKERKKKTTPKKSVALREPAPVSEVQPIKDKDDEKGNDEKAEKPKKVKKEKKPQKPKGYSLFETLRLLREGKTPEEIAEERKLAVSTIGSHLWQLKVLGKYDIHELFSEEEERTLRTLREMNPESKFGEIREMWGTDMPDYKYSLLWRFTSPPPEDKE